jgi:phosphatidylethanolamine-binding protein (PEBP) family uncharacterized protein
MDFYLGNKQIVSLNKQINVIQIEDLENVPRIVLPELDSNKYHSLIISDLDAPYPETPDNSPFIHLIMINMLDGDPGSGDVVTEWLPFNPPENSSSHRYIINAYEQDDHISTMEQYSRVRYPLSRIENQYNLKLIAKTMVRFGY